MSALYKSERWPPGFVGTLCFTLPEALWLAENGSDDLVVAYPTVDRKALRELAHTSAREQVTVMVDCREHLDAIEAAGGRSREGLHRRRRRLADRVL